MFVYQKLLKYFSRHPTYSAIVHLLIGIGVGILITYPVVGSHPLRWGLAILTVGLLAHLYPLLVK